MSHAFLQVSRRALAIALVLLTASPLVAVGSTKKSTTSTKSTSSAGKTSSSKHTTPAKKSSTSKKAAPAKKPAATTRSHKPTTESPRQVTIPHPEDGVGAQVAHHDDLRGVRFMEFVLVGNLPVDGQIKGSCYNTTGLNGVPGARDSAPAAEVSGLRAEELARRENVPRVVLNPPRQWLIDWIDLPTGKLRKFGGLDAAWIGLRNVPKDEWPAYTARNVARTARLGYRRGSTVYLLDDPDGRAWVLKSITQVVDAQNTLARLESGALRLHLPAGWKVRTRVLDRDLLLDAESGTARILRDELNDLYDVTGPGFSNYVP